MSEKSTNVRLLAREGQTVTPDVLLEVAKNANLAHVVIVGMDQEAELFLSASMASIEEVHWLLCRAAHKAINGDFGGIL